MAIEVEARFRVTDPAAVARLSDTARLGPAELGRPMAFEETDAYLDTADGALEAARWLAAPTTGGGGSRDPGAGSGALAAE